MKEDMASKRISIINRRESRATVLPHRCGQSRAGKKRAPPEREKSYRDDRVTYFVPWYTVAIVC